MTILQGILIVLLLAIQTIASYIDRMYSEMGKFLARDFQENIDVWEQQVEPRLGMSSKHVMQSAAILTPLSLAALVLIFGDVALRAYRLYGGSVASDVAQLVLAIVLATLIFRSFLPQLLFTRTNGRWIARFTLLLRVLFYLVLPVTLALGFLLSIAALAESGEPPEEEHPSEAVEALIEAGKEEGILEESDHDLVRSAVEFGDKIVRDVMTPRPAIFAVPATMTLAQFTEELRSQAYSRVPVYGANLDDVVGIAFMHDLLHITDVEAATSTVGKMARSAMFTPETKNIRSLLREMQQNKQHMALVIDEYGGLAGLITIEDIVEEIVGAISDEHETPEPGEAVQSQPDGSYIVPGNFELANLDRLFPNAVPLSQEYESTTLGGLITEEAGHIPFAGEVIHMAGLRLEVLASSAHRVDRIRVQPAADSEQSVHPA
ncbi:MAG TPA: hemolysin family protein [Acidobacteriaceae bacterium]|nr:hemolysin family protein [Acidobacteriaceae bacterium]